LIEAESDAAILNRRGELVVKHSASTVKREAETVAALPTLQFLSGIFKTSDIPYNNRSFEK
jgi:hypothetical protein